MPTTLSSTSPLHALKNALTEFDGILRQAPSKIAMDDNTAAPSASPAEVSEAVKSIPEVAVPKSYVPRKLPGAEFFGMTDVQFVAKAAVGEMPILLFGPPGTGKTSMVLAAMPNTITVAGTSETETSDFVGSWTQKTDGTYEWVDGPLPVAMESGVPLLVDEVAQIDPRVMAVVYSVMDGRNELYITANPARGTVKSKPGFVVFGACNPHAPGSMMSDALLSRFQLHLEVGTDWELAKTLGCGTKIITAARNLGKRFEAHEILAAPQLRELLTFRDTTMLFGEVVALRNFVTQARETDRDVYAEVLSDVFGQKLPALKI